MDGNRFSKRIDAHPWFGRKDRPNERTATTTAGRYQIKLITWYDAVRNRGYGTIPVDFSYETQFRIALHLMLWCGIENMDAANCRTTLALIREGGDSQIIEAVKKLSIKGWTSLPRNELTPHPNANYAMDDFLKYYNTYLSHERSML